MSGNTSLVSATPGFVAGTYGAKDVRLATIGNGLPGLFTSGDFAVSQRAAGANMSVDVAQGRALIDPGGTHQGLYLARRTSATAYNTSTDGGYTWTAADGANARIDLLCAEAKDTDEDAGGVTGWRFRIVDGTASAAATHQLVTSAWPAIPAGVVPIAAIRVPAAATTITAANISSLNPVAGGRSAYSQIAAAETTTSATYTRLTTPDFVFAYVPHTGALVFVGYKALWKIAAAATANAALFINGTQLTNPKQDGVPTVTAAQATLTAIGFLNHLNSHSAGLQNVDNSTAGNSSDVTTGETIGVPSADARYNGGVMAIFGLTAGWYVFEMRYKTSASTLTSQGRYMNATVVG